MKKILTLFAAMSLMASVNAQNQFEVTDRNYVQEFIDEFVSSTGISSNGKYVFGAIAGGEGPAAAFDLKGDGGLTWFEPEIEETYGVTVAGITYDGIALVSENDILYTYNLNDGTKTYLESPKKNLGMDAWDITSDGSFFAGNFTDEMASISEPLIGIKQEDGTYKIVALDFDKYDAFGTEAQFSQARYVTEDGSRVIGLQIDARGKAPRAIVWERQEDGTYKFTTPMDPKIYDQSVEVGKKPVFEEYVTADPETEPELYKKQKEEYSKDFYAYEDRFNQFTKNSTLDVFKMHRGKKSNIVYAGVNTDDGTYPIIYNCDTKELTTYEEDLEGYAFEDLPGGGFITFDDAAGPGLLYALNTVAEDGTTQMFTEWLNEHAGVDYSNEFYVEMTNPMTGGTAEGVFPGLPYFSHDGKSLVLSGLNQDFEYSTCVINFDRDIFAALATGIEKVNVTNKVSFGKNVLNIGEGKQGVAEVYTMNGMNCGSFNVNGSIDLNGTLAAGTYVVKMNVEGAQPVSMKIIIK